MMARGGFIVLHRKAIESRLWTLPATQFRIGLRLLLEANWRDSWIRWFGAERRLLRGQVLVGERKLAEREECGRQVVRDTIEALIRQESVTAERTHRGTNESRSP